MLRDVVITKLFLPERRGNLLLTNIKQEPTSEGSPSQSLSVPDQCSSSNMIHNTASADARLHMVTGGECVNSLPFRNDTLSGSSISGVTLPLTTQSSGPSTYDAFNHRPVHSSVPRPTPLSKRCTQPATSVSLNSQPPMVNTCSQHLGSNTRNPVVSIGDPNRLATSSAANRIDEEIMNPASTDDNLLWGRIARNSSGDLRFPGINRTFKSAYSVLRQIYQSAMAQDSLTLQLPASAIQCENEANIRLENSLPNSLLNSTSRKGFYICLCCRATFTSSALYEDHLDRTVARILYRCHLCRASWTTTSREAVSIADVNTSHHHRPEDNSRNPSESTSSSVVAAGSSHEVTLAMIPTTTTTTNNNNNNSNNHESEISSRFYSVLPGGIISANNKCAIFTHLTSVHPDKRSDWILRPSLLTICPLVTPATYLNLAALTASTTTSTTADTQPSDAGNEPAPTRQTSNQLVKTHLNDLCKSRVWSDLQHSLSNISALGSLDFLQSSSTSSASSSSQQVSSNPVGRLTRTHDDIIVETFSSLRRIFTPSSSNNSESNLPSLPCSDSVLCRLILNCATSEIWHSHLFLPERCNDEARAIGTTATTTTTAATTTTKTVNHQGDNNPVTAETNNNNVGGAAVENGQTNNGDNSVNVGGSYSAITKKLYDTCLPPSAPSNAHLNWALNVILSSYRSSQSSTPSSSSSSAAAATATASVVQSSDSINRRGDLENNDNLLPIQATSKNLMVTSSSDQLPAPASLSQQQKQQPFGVLRCLLCNFQTNDKQKLKIHLMGSGRTVLNTKCGLCGQLLSIVQSDLCLIKAHLLLHLGCYLMCPQCGFTPPPYLSPDCAELCLRVHLRFVCFHFNLREIFQCCYCHESDNRKGYKSFENLCQHYFECHSKRIYSCLICIKHQEQLESIGISNNNNNSQQPSTSFRDETGNSGNTAVIPNNNNTSSVPMPVISNRSYTSTIHHVGGMHAINRENMLLQQQLQYSTSSLQTSSGPDSNMLNSSHDLANISLPRIEELTLLETSSFEELTYHMRVVHGAHTPSSINSSTATIPPLSACSSESQTVLLPSALVNSTQPAIITTNLLNTTSLRLPLPSSASSSSSSTVTTTPSSHSNAFVNINGVPVVYRNHGNNYNASEIRVNSDYSTRFQCIECMRFLDTREEYFRHFSAEHRLACIHENYYRCFGSCKRLFPNIDVFREHLSVCQHAQTIFQSTFGYSYTYSNDNNDNNSNNNSNQDILNLLDPEHADDNQQQQSVRTSSSCENNASSSSSAAASSSHGMNNASVIFSRKLCFCAYCGIGPRRSISTTGGIVHPSSTMIIRNTSTTTTTAAAATTTTTATTMTSTSYSLCMDHPHGQITSDSVMLPAESNGSNEVTQSRNNEINLGLQNQDSTADNGYISDCSHASNNNNNNNATQQLQLQPLQQQGQQHESPTNRDTPFTARYFTDLMKLQNHERDSHFYDCRNFIACPWCHKQLSFSKKENSNGTYEHLLSHIHKHRMATWYLARTRQWNENAKDEPAPTRQTSNQLVKTHLNDLCKSRVWSDLQHSLSNISALGSLDFLQSSSTSSASSSSQQVSSNPVGRLTRTHDDIIVETFSSLRRIFTPSSSNNSESNLPSLPCSDSVLCRLILNCATSEIWHSHLFLPERCNDETRTICTPATTTATTTKTVNHQDESNPVTAETNNNNVGGAAVENGQTNNGDNSVNVGGSYSAITKKLYDTCLPPSAPSNAHLNWALNVILSSYRSSQSSTPSSSSSSAAAATASVVQSSDSINRRGDLENNDNLLPIQATSKNLMVTSSSDQLPAPASLSQQQKQQPFGVLRCLLCNFQTNDKQRLKIHLMGSGRTVLNTKCGLCGQLLSIVQSDLCLIKAHLLLHLGCYLMCPQCGFTPPPYLSPDCAELCLRVHLRFVCFHFNLREIFQCCYCHESDNRKGYKSFENLCQHYFECHSKRIYSCLICIKHQEQLKSIGISNNNNNSQQPSTSFRDETGNSGNTAVIPNNNNNTSSVPMPVISNRSYTSTIHHVGGMHVMNRENMLLQQQLQYSTSSLQTSSGPDSNMLNSSHDLANISLPRIEELTLLETSSFEELTYHMRVVHGAHTPSSINSSTATIPPLSACSSESQTVLLPSALVNSTQPAIITTNLLNTTSLRLPLSSSSSSSTITTTPSSHSNAFVNINGVPVVYRNHDNNYNASEIRVNSDYSTRFQCIECMRFLDTREEYFRHFSAEHRLACIHENYYRCFGSCKRLFPNIDVFREHLSVCQHAQTIFQSTFGYSYTYSNDNNDNNSNNNSNQDILNLLDPEHADDNQQQQSVRTSSSCENNASSSSSAAASSSHGMNNASVIFSRKLCFCAYCGIGPRRNISTTGGIVHPSSTMIIRNTSTTTTTAAAATTTTTTTMTSTSYSLCMDHPHGQITSDSVMLPAESNGSNEVTQSRNNEINLGLQNQDSTADNGYISDCSHASNNNNNATQQLQLQPLQQQGQQHESPTNRDTPFTARYFTDLMKLQNHERDSHFYDCRNFIACPWCHKQLSFSKKENSNGTYEHLLSHIHKHRMATWYLARTRQWNENAKALPHCVCGLALLDSPLAILSHAGTHLIHADKYKSSSIVLPDPIQLRRLKRQHPHASSSSSNNRQYSSEEFLFPKPNDHIPCCIEVYRHLRFGVSPGFDAYLLEATKGSLTFTCPICSTVLCTRWALTQHAFSEHWGTLCYICCTYTFNPEENSPSLDISVDCNAQIPSACPSVSSLPAIASSSSSLCPPTLIPSSLMTTKKIASTSTTATATATPTTEIVVPQSMKTSANLWDHIFQCMNSRRDLLNGHHHQHGPFPPPLSSSSSLTKSDLRVNDDDNNHHHHQHHDHHQQQQQLFIGDIDLDRSEISDCDDPSENFNDSVLTIVSSPEHEMITNTNTTTTNNNNADKNYSDVSLSPRQIPLHISETCLSSNISTDAAISATSASNTTIPMTAASLSLSSAAAPVPATTSTTAMTTTNTAAAAATVAARPPLPSCTSPIEYVHKIFNNKYVKRKASTTTTSEISGSTRNKRVCPSLNKGDCNNVQGSCHRIIEGVGVSASVGGDDNDQLSPTNNSATTTPCVDEGAQEQVSSGGGGTSRSSDDTNVTEMSAFDRPTIPSGVVSNPPVCQITYKCYVCQRRFTARSSCLRHMTNLHGAVTSELQWNLLTETNYVASTPSGPKNNNPNLLSLLNNSSNNNTPASGSGSTAPPATTSSSSLSKSGESVREENDNSSSSGGGVVRKIFFCSLCNKCYRSRHSLLRHKTSHHGQTDSQTSSRQAD
ncbi:unnamed protein product [Trichobilharzia szidati]|nr:unnamed protein product [Trichobilharzia szidati]